MAKDGDDKKLMKVFLWATSVNPDDCKNLANAKRASMHGAAPLKVARALVASYARKGGLEGFITGLPTNPFVAVGSAGVDAGFLLRFFATMNAAIGYLADENYFEDPDWRNDLLIMLAGAAAVGKILQEAGVAFSKQAAKQLIRKYLSKEVLRALKRWVLKWLGKKITQRVLITKMIPIIGGIIGGTWNYVEIRIVGSRVVEYHFDGSLS